MRIGIANDSFAAGEILRRVVVSEPGLALAWMAKDGEEAAECCRHDLPDVVLMDLLMPKMNGVEATRCIMRETPCAILVVTGSVESNMGLVFDAMGAGALDAVDTPLLDGAGSVKAGAALLAKIATIGKLVRHGPLESARAREWHRSSSPRTESTMVAIGSSAGGPQALATVLKGFPRDFQASVVIVQHVDQRFAPGLVRWLAESCVLPVDLARAGEYLEPGRVWVAGTNDHLILAAPDQFGISQEPLSVPYRPSIDVFFHSVVQQWRGQTVGVLLTGMGRDGAVGLKALREAHAHTIAQDRETSAVYGMPKAAADLQAAVEILPIGGIASAVLHRVLSAHHQRP